MTPLFGTITWTVSLPEVVIGPVVVALGFAALAGVWWLIGRIGEEARRVAAREWESRRSLGTDRIAA